MLEGVLIIGTAVLIKLLAELHIRRRVGIDHVGIPVGNVSEFDFPVAFPRHVSNH
jgi:hypothetical protein